MFKFLFVVIIFMCKAKAIEVDENHIFLYFYSPINNNISTSVPLNRSNLIAADLNLTSDVKVIIHGYGVDHKIYEAQRLIDAFLSSGEHSNVIFLDFGKYARFNYYDLVTMNDQIVHIITKDLISFAKVNKIPLSKFHLIGASYGAQLCGLIGQQIYNKTGSKLRRITGLDPVGPLFIGGSTDASLDASDAIFVDVIHTCVYIGFFEPCGTIDFWPNGGKYQRGCDPRTACSHTRALEYYIESINSKNLSAWECYDESMFNQGLCEEGHYVIMGEHVDTTAQGQYFLHTNAKSPYGCKC